MFIDVALADFPLSTNRQMELSFRISLITADDAFTSVDASESRASSFGPLGLASPTPTPKLVPTPLTGPVAGLILAADHELAILVPVWLAEYTPFPFPGPF